MTNKEAIAILENLKTQGKAFLSQRLALDKGIEALEERPTGEWVIDGHHYKCSRCGKTLAIMFSETDDDDLIGCPFCLAYMGGAST